MSDELEIPESWAVCKLRDIAEIKNGFAFKSNLFTSKDGMPLIRIRDISRGFTETFYTGKYEEEFVVNNGDLLVGMDGNFECHKWMGGKALLNQRVCKIQPKGKINPDLIMLHLNSVLPEIQRKTVKVTVAHLSSKQLNDLAFPLPPSAEQERLFKKTNKIFSLIETIEKSSDEAEALLKKYRESLLAKAFRGELVPQDPKEEPASKLLERIRAERNAKNNDKTKKQDELPLISEQEIPFEIPKSWAWVRLSDIAIIQGGIQKQPSRAPKKNRYPFLRVANVLKGRLDLDDVHEVELFEGELERLKLENSDLLIVEGNGSANEIGRMAVWRGEIKNCVHQNHLIRARASKYIEAEFVELYWNSSTGRDQLTRVAKSTSGLLTLSVSKVGSILVPIPPIAEQAKILKLIHSQTAELSKVVMHLDKLSRSASCLRRAILAAAFSGRLVTQDSSEGSGQELLTRISSSTADLEKKLTTGIRKARKKEKI